MSVKTELHICEVYEAYRRCAGFFLLESYGSFLEYLLEDSLETRFYLHDHFKMVIILRCFRGLITSLFCSYWYFIQLIYDLFKPLLMLDPENANLKVQRLKYLEAGLAGFKASRGDKHLLKKSFLIV